jgi:hypothetical protein
MIFLTQQDVLKITLYFESILIFYNNFETFALQIPGLKIELVFWDFGFSLVKM